MKAKGANIRSVKVGCCGLRLARAEYFARFPAVEVQHTFYQPPQLDTLWRWREEAPDSFEFTIKAWMLITHEARSPTYRRLKRELTEEERAGVGSFRPTRIVREAWEVTRACAEALRAKRVLFQCPASFKPVPENVRHLRKFFKSIRGEKFELLWEPRGEWPRELIEKICAEFDLTHVVDPFSARTVTPLRCYYRLHGRGGFHYVYEDDELAELLSTLPRAAESHVMFNNVRMVDDATRFLRLLDEDSDDEE